MKRTRYHIPLTLVAAIVAVGSSLAVVMAPDVRPAGGDDGPETASARQRWELKRLRDPKTGRIPENVRAREMAFAAALPVRDALPGMYKSAGIADNDWKSHGPHNIGGRTRALAFDVTGEDTIIAGGVSGGLWRSSDGGTTWTRTTLRWQLPSVSCLAQDTRPGKTHVWYAGTGELYGNSASDGGSFYTGDGLYKSTDNGRSWRQLSTSDNPFTFDDYLDNFWNIAVDRSNLQREEVYGALFGFIVRSLNGGANWQYVLNSADEKSYATDVAVTSTGVVYATMSDEGVKRGIWRSTDGAGWVNITPPNWPERYRRTVIAIAPSNENVVYFLGETPGSGMLGKNFRGDSSWQSLWKYTYVSGDGSGAGGTWEDRSANLPNYGPSNGDFFSQGGYDLLAEVKPDDEHVIFIGGTNLYRSTDGFATPAATKWIGGFKYRARDSALIENYQYPNHHPDQHVVDFSPTNRNIVLNGNDGGVYKTLDAFADSVHWIDLNRGYLTTQFYNIAIDQATPGNEVIIGGLQDNGTWRSNGSESSPWVEMGTSDGGFSAIADGRGSMYVSKQEGRLFRAVTDGNGVIQSWTRSDPAEARGVSFINPFSLDPANTSMLYYAGGRYLWRNSDMTDIPLGSKIPTMHNWQRLEKSIIADSTTISAIGVSRRNPEHRVYYGTDNGQVYRIDNAHEGDPDATLITGANFPRNANVTCVTVDPDDADKVFVVFSNYNVLSLFYSTDGGETWTPVGGNLEESFDGRGLGPSFRWIEVLRLSSGPALYLLGTSTGLYSTTRLDSSRTVWTQEGAETIGNVVVTSIVRRNSDGFVAVGTHGSGIFSTHIAVVGVENEQAATGAARPTLRENRPNPVRSTTAIDFTIPPSLGPTRTRLTIHDPQGRLVATPVDAVLEPGDHTATLDIAGIPYTSLPSGTYFYRLEAGGAVETRKMVVVR